MGSYVSIVNDTDVEVNVRFQLLTGTSPWGGKSKQSLAPGQETAGKHMTLGLVHQVVASYDDLHGTRHRYTKVNWSPKCKDGHKRVMVSRVIRKKTMSDLKQPVESLTSFLNTSEVAPPRRSSQESVVAAQAKSPMPPLLETAEENQGKTNEGSSTPPSETLGSPTETCFDYEACSDMLQRVMEGSSSTPSSKNRIFNGEHGVNACCEASSSNNAVGASVGYVSRKKKHKKTKEQTKQPNKQTQWVRFKESDKQHYH